MTQSYKSESQITTSSSQESGHSHYPSWSHTEDSQSEDKPGLLGGVFHVVSANGRLIRMRMDNTGKIIYDKTVSSLNQLSKLRNVKDRLAGSPLGSRLSKVPGQAKPLLRRAVTGNRDKKIRDYMKEVPQVKFVDKLSFTFGVTCIVVAEFLTLRHPEYFPMFYYSILVGLLTNRYIEYSQIKEQLFMLDFCYFVNLSVIVQTALFPTCLLWFKANYVLSMGVLMLAIVIWQNSMVFHSLDKITSFLLHAFPGLTLHLYRWGLITCSAITPEDSLSLSNLIILPLFIYGLWQGLYLLITEVLLAEKMKADPELVTSLRYLAKDKKNSLNFLTSLVCKKVGIMSREEQFDSEVLKYKVIFVMVQGIFTLLCLIPPYFLYTNYALSFVYIVSIFIWCVWRGGTYYIEVFSERYKLKFIKQDSQTDETISVASNDEFFQDAVEDDAELVDKILEALKAADDESENIEEQENNVNNIENSENIEENIGVNGGDSSS